VPRLSGAPARIGVAYAGFWTASSDDRMPNRGCASVMRRRGRPKALRVGRCMDDVPS
jgi:hypothetical protein